jgi:hypothetical protein
MKCFEARLALLEEDLRTLMAEGDGPLAEHLRGCSDCQARAEVILRGEALLATELEKGVPQTDLARIIEIAGRREEGIIPFPARAAKWATRGPRVAILPVAAAAAVAILFLSRPPSLPGPEFTPEPVSHGLGVEAPEGHSMAVLETGNPDIKVVWLF